MSDQDTTTANMKVAALELEIVPVEEAEAEAAAAREADAKAVSGAATEQPAAVELDMGNDQLTEEGDQLAAQSADADATTVAQAQGDKPAELAGSSQSGESKADEKNDSLGDDEALIAQEEELGDDDDGFLIVDDNSPRQSGATNGELPSVAEIEGLTEIVIDAAGAANEAAHATNQSIQMLLGSVSTINKMAKDVRKTNSYVLGFLVLMGFLTLTSGGIMLYVLQGAVKDATAINVAMATKTVQFERGFEAQLGRLATLEAQLVEVADASHALGMRVEQAVHFMGQAGDETQQAVTTQATQSQAMLGSVNEQITDNFSKMQATSEQQQTVLLLLRQRIQSLEGQMQKIQNQDLVGKMKALIALEQQRYYELEQAKLEQQQTMFEAQQAAAKAAKPVSDSYISFGVQPETQN